MLDIGFITKVLENQGLVAAMLVYMIMQSNKEKAVLLSKICELNHFIMQLLKDELCEDREHPIESSRTAPNGYSSIHYPGGVVIPPEGDKV